MLAMRFQQKIAQTPVTTRQDGLQIVVFEIFVLQADVRFVAYRLPQGVQFGFDPRGVAPWRTTAAAWPVWAQTG